jgi:vacuolar-type H+-ATPase subunit E/Vma4
MDYTLCYDEVRSVDSTAAAKTDSLQREVDATDANLSGGEMRAVSSPLGLALVWLLATGDLSEHN